MSICIFYYGLSFNTNFVFVLAINATSFLDAGSYMWDLESYTKLMWQYPWAPPFGADWVKSDGKGRSVHYAEPRHSTIALTDEALKVITRYFTFYIFAAMQFNY